MKKTGIMVAGASGLLGANFVLEASRRFKNRQVVAVYHQHPVFFPGVDSVQVDLAAKGRAQSLVRFYQPEWLVFCAGAVNVDWCEEHPQAALQVNAKAALNLALACQELNSRMVYISTDAVFNGDTGGYAEEDYPEPVNRYARSKVAGEQAVSARLPSSLIVRTNIYGWNSQPKQSLAEWILGRLEWGLTVPGFYDVFFNPILVNDLSDLLLEMMHRRLTGVYHVAGSDICSKYEFALRLAGEFGLRADLVEPVSIKDSTLRAPRPRNTSLKTGKIREKLGKPMPALVSGLRRFKALRDSVFVQQLKECSRRLLLCQN